MPSDNAVYMHQLLDLIGDESTLRTLSKHVMKVFPNQDAIRDMWKLLPTEYVTIPLQGALRLGTHQKRHGAPKSRREKTTQLTSVMFRFCEMREGEFISKTTFNEALDIIKLPRFTHLTEIELYSLVDLSVKALQVFFLARDTKQMLDNHRQTSQSCTSQAHVQIAEHL
jgi:hypothetical protein